MIKLEGMSLDDFCDIIIEKTGLENNTVIDIFRLDVANWLGIDYSSITYAFVYFSDILREFNDAHDDENNDEVMVLDELIRMDPRNNDEEDYFIVFND